MRKTGVIIELVLGLVAAVSCKKTDDSAAAAASASAAAAVAAAASASAAVAAASASAATAAMDSIIKAEDFGQPGPLVVKPAIILKPREGGDHAKHLGWAKDSSEFAACSENGNTGALDCSFLKPFAKLERKTDFDASAGLVAAKTKELRDRMVAKGYSVANGNWAFAQDITLEWKASCDAKTSKCIFRLGGKDKEGEFYYPMYIEIKDVLGIHPDAVALSPDEKFLGVIAHGSGGEGVDKFELRVVTTRNFVAQIYNDLGMSHHKKKDFEKSAHYFHNAMQADPSLKLAHYNYACALALLKHPDTEKALKSAIDVGGPTVKARAAKDSDFAAVASETWFKALTQ